MDVFVGTDIEEVHRLKKIIDFKQNYLKHLFFHNELIYALKKNRPECTLTGIWCAKEAVIKAMNPIIKLSLQDIEIINKKDSNPTVKLKKELSFNYAISLSISHTRNYATATAIINLY